MSNNAHKLLSHPVNNCLLNRTKLTAKQERVLKSARDEIRQRVRTALRNWSDFIDNDTVFFTEAAPSERDTPLVPRFRMQGSMQYGTANQPPHKPPQEMDLDDGVFLPTPSIQAAGDTQPVLLVGGLFTVVENALQDLCDERGWTIQKKSTCVRVKLAEGQHSHVDVPIYAVPKGKFDEIALNFQKSRVPNGLEGGIEFAEEDNALEMLTEAYEQLASADIMLAHREQGWLRSDPRQLEHWFVDAKKRHGQQLKRICRVLKAWRDHRFENGGPSSIALMCCVVAVFDEFANLFDSSRDDLAIQRVANELPRLFAGRIPNPVTGCPDLNEGWSPEERQHYISEARDFSAALGRAIDQADSPEKVVAEFEELFGPRFPADAEALVEMSAELAVSTTALIDQLAERDKPPPPTKKSQGERRYA